MKNIFLHPGLINYLLLIGIGIIWGLQFMFNEWALSSIPPTTIAASRSLIGAIILSIFLIGQRRNQSFIQSFHGPWFFYFIIGLTEAAIPFSLVAWGQGQIDSGTAAILMGTIPVFTIVLTKIFIPKEQLTKGSLLSVIIGFIGIWILISPTSVSGLQNSLWGELAVLGAALSFSISLILINKLPDISPIATSRNILIGASTYLVPASLLIDQPWNIQTSILSLFFLLILGTMCGGIVYVMYVMLIVRAGATFTSLNNYLVPVIGTMIGIGFLGEKLTWSTIVALVLIIIAMISNELGKSKEAKSV
ncbi:DMT family transporter [Domibacillus sp. A3M-37]|uniref:DMT family transporter n=1 Tax=Domibacillus sp. A3M-37 TaxID=2962037 RepID=UPI0020B70FFA|nr:DMT family transporter [Domibacillus sp. A3M-37]MCP3764717.1 DMT family transporter [Domibacillus sp. A3M-37]